MAVRNRDFGSRVTLTALGLSGAFTVGGLMGLLSQWLILPGIVLGGISGLLMAAFCVVAGQQALEEDVMAEQPTCYLAQQCEEFMRSGGTVPVLCHQCQACAIWKQSINAPPLPDTPAIAA